MDTVVYVVVKNENIGGYAFSEILKVFSNMEDAEKFVETYQSDDPDFFNTEVQSWKVN